jgi:hypothetical protein
MVKQAASFCLYLGSIPLAFVSPWIAIGMIVIVAIIWLLPPRKIVLISSAKGAANRSEHKH